MYPRTWILVISAGDLHKVDEPPTDDVPDVLQRFFVARHDCLPVNEICRVEFDSDNKILGYISADFGSYPTKKVQLLAIFIRA